MSAGIGLIRHDVPGLEFGSAHLATLRFGLVSDDELRDDDHETDLEPLALRFLAVTRWVRGLAPCAGLPVGFFGVGTAGAAALWAASEDPGIGAVVARDSPVELARTRLSAVFAPTMLVVGSDDPHLRLQNERSGRRLRCEHRIALLNGDVSSDAGDRVARDWFVDHLGRPPGAGQALG